MLDKNNQKGATMMEMLGVLTIIIMLGVSAIKLIGNIFDMFKQNLVVNEVRDLQKVISERYKFEGNYKGLLENRTPEQVSAFLCTSKMAPYQMCSNGLLHHRMGGEVWVMPIVNYDGDGNELTDYSKYALVFWGLTDRTCVNAAQINWYMQQKSDIFKMVINGDKADKRLSVDMPYNMEEGSKIFPVNPSDVMRACSNGDEDDKNKIEWVFF